MQKLKGIICFYLTAVLMLLLALSPFASENAIKNAVSVFDKDACTEEISLSDSVYKESDKETTVYNTVLPAEDNPSAEESPVNESLSSDTSEVSDENAPSEKNEETEAQNSSLYEASGEEAASAGKVSAELHENENTSSKDFSVISADTENAYTPGAPGETVSGLNFFTDTVGFLEASDSINVYDFTLDARSVFSFTVFHDKFTDASGWKFNLYAEYLVNGDGEETAYRLINSLSTTTAPSDSSPELGLMAGYYRLVVTRGQGYTGSAFRISVSLDETYAYETECNDNIYRYTEIYGDSSIKGSASKYPDRQDEDWYMLRMYEDGYIELSFSHPAVKDKLTVCWQLIFYSEDMTEMFSVNSTFDKNLFESGRIGLEKGNYYIAVINRVYTDMTYTLNVERTTVSDHENERNDTKDTANTIAPGDTMLGIIANQISGIDVDYYKFTLSAPAVISIEFSHNPIEDEDDRLGWNFRLYDENDNLLFSGTSAWIDDVSVSSSVGLGTGAYYIRIDSEGLYHSTEKYYLSVLTREETDWETESNDSFTSADTLSAEKAITGLLADKNTDYDFDYYTFELKSASDITMLFSHEKRTDSKEIFIFTLYDGNEKAIETSYGGNTVSRISIKADAENTEVKYSSLPAGKYYVRVATGIFFDQIEYSLTYKTS